MAKEKTTKKKVNYTKAQAYGLWGLILSLALFWGGVAVGTQWTLNMQAQEEQVKAQAIEAYKATLKASEQ